MKKIAKIQFLFVVAISLLFLSCKDKMYEEVSFTGNIPVYMDFDEFRSSVQLKDAKEMGETGKIYLNGRYIFINELLEGVHIINNSDPANPVNEGFISIPGNVDISIKDNILYADSYIDLVAIDISDLNNPVEIERVENAFPNIFPPVNSNYPVAPVDFSKGVVTGWTIGDVTVKYDVEYNYNPNMFVDDVMLLESSDAMVDGNTRSTSVGIGGSLARFAIKGNTLLAINNGMSLKMFDITAPTEIIKGDSINVSTTIETLFTKENNLFIGSTTGMFIYDITNPNAPVLISQYWHMTSCDPVVVEGEYAYVTLRTGTTCFGSINELHVIDISNINSPTLIKQYEMYNPYGLGIDNGTLFICDGTAGLKIYDATDPLMIAANQIVVYSDIKPFDVIPLDGILILIAEDGLYQYDYSDLENITLLSFLAIGN
jgi:hypothetical protein